MSVEGVMSVPIRDVIREIQANVQTLQRDFTEAHKDTMDAMNAYVQMSEKRLQLLESDIPLRNEIRGQFKSVQERVAVHTHQISELEAKMGRLGKLEDTLDKVDKFVTATDAIQKYQRWLFALSFTNAVALGVAILIHFSL